MASIHARGISNRTRDALRVRAAKVGMSLEAHTRRALQMTALARRDASSAVVDLASKTRLLADCVRLR